MRKHETAVCGTARTVVWEVGKCENRRRMPFMISIYLLPDCPLFGIADNKTFAIGPLEFMADIIPFVQ